MYRHSIARTFRLAASAVAIGAVSTGAAPLLAGGIPAAAIPDQAAQSATAGIHSDSSKASSVKASSGRTSEHGPAHSRSHGKVRPSPAKPSPDGPAPQVAAAPAAPALPNWPMNNKPLEATVLWNSHGLSVNAHNSSLRQILSDICMDTGARLEGPTPADVRVFGTYGPGPASEVISQLLNGTGYNLLMIGDQGSGAPRQIVLSSEPSGPAPPNDTRSSGDEDNYQPEPVAQPVMNNGFVPQPRTAQQMEEMQLRQEQLQQQLREQMMQRPMPPDDNDAPPPH
jgi:hypothetical protein